LKKLKFENFDIFTNNIINVEVAKVLKYVCFEELGDLELIGFEVGSIFWIVNSLG
jgi:hypothetical protein